VGGQLLNVAFAYHRPSSCDLSQNFRASVHVQTENKINVGQTSVMSESADGTASPHPSHYVETVAV